MNMEINSKNLHLLLPGKVTGVAKLYAEDHSCSILEAMRRFYSTKLYKNLAIETTKLWHLGIVGLYEMWIEEEKD